MPRILFIGSGAPWAGGAGYLVRQNLFLQALREVGDLHLAIFDLPPGQMPPFPAKVTAIPLPIRRKPSTAKRLFDDVFASTPRMFRGYDLRASRAVVESLQPDGFDVVFAFRIDFAHFAGVMAQTCLILDIDDPEHLRWQRRVLATTGGPGDWRTRLDLKKLRRWEFDAESSADIAFVCQANEATGWPVPPVVVPNCVDLIENPQRIESGPRVLFVGNSAGGEQSPNADGLKFFLSAIWPAIRKEVPDARFHVVGATSDAIRGMAAKIGGVDLCGFVSDLREVYAAASISIAPIRFGTGTRIKILEAFAHACPVVSTIAGADGIDAAPGREIEIATDGPSFAAHCVKLLRDSSAREMIGAGGYALAARLYDRKLQHGRVVKLLKDYLEGPK